MSRFVLMICVLFTEGQTYSRRYPGVNVLPHERILKKEDCLDSYEPIIVQRGLISELQPLRALYETMLLKTLGGIVERFQRHPTYGFIDTKIDIHTAVDLAQDDAPTDLFGRDTIYGWIQGRGLEALVGHHEWLKSVSLLNETDKQHLQTAISDMIRTVVTRMESIRAQNHGHLFFWLDRGGRAFTLDGQGRKIIKEMTAGCYTVTDIFYAKGFLAAALFLNDDQLVSRARSYFTNVVHEIGTDTLVRDQQSFDPKNPAGEVAGRFSHGARMLGLGGLSLAARHTDDPIYISTGLGFIAHVLDRHVNLNGRFPDLQEYDFTEFIDSNGGPYHHKGTIISDSGHACEFVGLALKFLLTVEAKQGFTPEQQEKSEAYKPILRQVLFHNFTLGFNEEIGGICKNYSLDRREPANSDMPWWNLPETMRSAMLAYHTCTHDGDRQTCMDIARKCSNAFLTNYINPDVYWMAYQTLDEHGRPIKVIPATPDLDPGYHTGLSIIDFLEALPRETETGASHD